MDQIFRKSFRGFNCEDVIGYIEKMQRENADDCSDLNKKVSALESDLAKAKEASAAAEALRSDIERYKSEIDSLNSTVATLKAELNHNIEMHSKIGDIFVDARTVANQIVDNAKVEASSISTETHRCANAAVGGIDATYSDLQQLQSDMSGIMSAFSQRLEEISASLDGAKLKIRAYAGADEKPVVPFTDAPSAKKIQSAAEAAEKPYIPTIDNIKYM